MQFNHDRTTTRTNSRIHPRVYFYWPRAKGDRVGPFDFLAMVRSHVLSSVLALWGFPLSPLPMDFLNIDFLKGGKSRWPILIRWPRRNHRHRHHHTPPPLPLPKQTPCNMHNEEKPRETPFPDAVHALVTPVFSR